MELDVDDVGWKVEVERTRCGSIEAKLLNISFHFQFLNPRSISINFWQSSKSRLPEFFEYRCLFDCVQRRIQCRRAELKATPVLKGASVSKEATSKTNLNYQRPPLTNITQNVNLRRLFGARRRKVRCPI